MTLVDLLTGAPAGLGTRARAIGATLVRRGLTGHRVLVALPPGGDYVAHLLGCLHAGVVAVPVSPEPSARLDEIVDDAQPAAAIGRVAGVEQLTGLDGDPRDQCRPDLDSDPLALLQYADTGPVRGVMLTHGNLVAGATQLVRHLGMRPDTGVVSYLSPYRDLGLVGGVLAPLLVGAPVTLVPADASPAAWLHTISARRARIGFAPDLAHAWHDDREYPALDLSTWDVAVTGAGPATLDRFANRLARHGFRRSALFPAYWSPEATALVAGRPGLAVNGFDEDTLEPGRLVKPGATALVDRGRAVSELDVAIVDPLTATRCSEGTTGEVWVAGPNVAVGYLGRPATSEQTFCARLRGSTQNYLRTGELGFLHNGGLHLVEPRPVLVTR
ncbi:AMP-binding protein [Actinophytocola sp. NPDC049390]|uniref:AMP-binding protein n=1 Tax=Actinophytocola sp. NPDC049390 TaxID=3363894 RepID=UPI0037A60EA6